MQLKRKVVIFGAGKNGEKILQRLGEENVVFFCDNYKSGEQYQGKKVIDFSELQEIDQNSEYDLILSTNVNSIRNQLNDSGIRYWESFGMENNFFHRKEIQDVLDENLLEHYLTLDCCMERMERDSNWFRKSYISEKNKRLVIAMENKNREEILKILSDTYDSETGTVKLDVDEYYVNRPGMRLIAELVRRDRREKVKVCDLACGHGDFLKNLQSDHIECYGTDISSERCQKLAEIGIACRLGDLEDSGYENETFDYVTMMECLEHVEDPFVAMEEAYRILKKGAQVFVTVPYGTNCDSDMHVRQFYENDLYSVAKKCGYTDIKIMRVPYLDSSYNDNLFMTAKKA